MELISNVSYYAQVRREDKLNEKLREKTREDVKMSIDRNREDMQKELFNDMVQKDGVSYEKTIAASVSAGLMFLQNLEKQFDGAKFHVGTVGYGQTYGDSSDTNFVVNPDFLSKLGTDEATRKQFEEDVNYLNEFSKRFRAQQLSQGREIISQGWFCDENGNWGGWSISRPVDAGSVLQDMADTAEEIRLQKLEEKKKAEQELKDYFGDRFKSFYVEWLEEETKTEENVESKEAEEASAKESESVSGSIGVNAGKLARKIAAAKTTEQLRTVIAEIESDVSEVKDGIEKGLCDQTELDKLKILMSMAQGRMGQVEDREATPEEENMFLMASLM